jgi:hypothetical protein
MKVIGYSPDPNDTIEDLGMVCTASPHEAEKIPGRNIVASARRVTKKSQLVEMIIEVQTTGERGESQASAETYGHPDGSRTLKPCTDSSEACLMESH